MFDENSNAAATLVGPAGTNTALHTANLNSTHLFNQLLNVKDSRWLQLEVCREFQRGQCSRSDVDCKFAHPPAHVDVQNGRVTACYDSIKGRCTRENPKCKYLHPPQHLKDQLLINGRNNLAIKNLISSQLIQPAAIPNNLQMAQLMQQQSQPMQTLPYQYYSTPLTAIYPLIPTANPGDFQTSNGMPNGKRLDKNGLSNGHAIPIYAQQPTAGPQFGPYIYAPVSYSGQIPPRF